jgi:hypothetical protein
MFLLQEATESFSLLMGISLLNAVLLHLLSKIVNLVYRISKYFTFFSLEAINVEYYANHRI